MLFSALALMAHLFPYQASSTPCPCSDDYLVAVDEASPLSVTPIESERLVEVANEGRYDLCPFCLEDDVWEDNESTHIPLSTEQDNAKESTPVTYNMYSTKRQFPSYIPSHFEGKGYTQRIQYSTEDSTHYHPRHIAYRSKYGQHYARRQLSQRNQ
jgi:hypothetical protein